MHLIPCSFSMSIEGRCILKEVQSDLWDMWMLEPLHKRHEWRTLFQKMLKSRLMSRNHQDAAKNVLWAFTWSGDARGSKMFLQHHDRIKKLSTDAKFGKGLLAKLQEVRRYYTSWFRLNRQFSLANYILTNTLILTSYKLCYLLAHHWILLLY